MRNFLLMLLVILITSSSYHPVYKKVELSSFQIDTTPVIVLDTITVRPNYHGNLEEYLARLVYSEAAGEPLEGKIAIVNVIQNRSLKTGRSIIQVVERTGQFDGRWTEQFHSKSVKRCESCKTAVTMALGGYRVIPKTVTYYHNTCTSTDKTWLKRIEPYVAVRLNNHDFFHHPDLIEEILTTDL